MVEFICGPNKWRTGTVVQANGTAALVVLHKPDELVLVPPAKGVGSRGKNTVFYVVKAEHARKRVAQRPKVTSLREAKREL